MSKHSVFIAGDPKAQPRTRIAQGMRKADGQRHNYVFTPTTANGWRYPVSIALGKLAAQIGHPIAEACRVDITFYFERPAGHWKSGQAYRVLKKSAPIYHITKPDRDNLDKLILDSAKSANLFADDRIVCQGEIIKKYATHEPPGCLVVINTDVGPNTVGELYDEALLDLTKHPRKAPGNLFDLSVAPTAVDDQTAHIANHCG